MLVDLASPDRSNIQKFRMHEELTRANIIMSERKSIDLGDIANFDNIDDLKLDEIESEELRIESTSSLSSCSMFSIYNVFVGKTDAHVNLQTAITLLNIFYQRNHLPPPQKHFASVVQNRVPGVECTMTLDPSYELSRAVFSAWAFDADEAQQRCALDVVRQLYFDNQLNDYLHDTKRFVDQQIRFELRKEQWFRSRDKMKVEVKRTVPACFDRMFIENGLL